MSDALVDTNVVLALLDPAHPSHASSASLVSQMHANFRLVVPPQVWFEAYVVLTRPTSVNGHGMTSEQAFRELRIAQSAFTVLPDPATIVDEWLNLCRTHSVLGKVAHDARLAAYARLLSITTLITLNPRDFNRYGLTVVVP